MIERVPEQYLYAGINGRLARLPIKDIDWIQAQRNYVMVHTGAAKHRIRSTLRNLAVMPGMNAFLQIHRSILINTAQVAALRMQSSNNLEVILRNGTALRVGRQYIEPVRARLHPKLESLRNA